MPHRLVTYGSQLHWNILKGVVMKSQKRLLPIHKVKGKYYTRIRWGDHGKYQVRFPLGTDNKAKAEHRRDKISSSSLRGKIIRAYEDHGSKGVQRIKDQIDWFQRSGAEIDTNLTMEQAIEEYRQYCIAQRLSTATIDLYTRAIKEFAKSSRVSSVDNIKKPHITQFKRGNIHLSPQTVNRKLRSLQTFFNWMEDEGYIKNTIRIKKLSVPKTSINYYSNAEFDVVLNNVKKGFPYGEATMDDKDREMFIDAFRLYRDTGLRLSEPFNNELKMDDEGYRLKIVGSSTKNSYQRFVHLTEQQAMTIVQMNDWLEKMMKTWSSRTSAIKIISRVWKKALRKSGIQGKFHDLRKTFASRLYFLTGQEFSLMFALGHTDTSMTVHYTKLDKVELNRAFPDIVAMKNSVVEDKNPLKVHKERYTEMYSNFGFIHDKV